MVLRGQVYAQAAGVNIFLIRKIYQLALASHGMFRRTRSDRVFRNSQESCSINEQPSFTNHIRSWAIQLGLDLDEGINDQGINEEELRAKIIYDISRSKNGVPNRNLDREPADAVDSEFVYSWSARPSEILWQSLKPKERAFEKLACIYNSDPSRLLDCCRQVWEEILIFLKQCK